MISPRNTEITLGESEHLQTEARNIPARGLKTVPEMIRMFMIESRNVKRTG